jgi:alpha-beta hydrolase superfamily lysophospholipase
MTKAFNIALVAGAERATAMENLHAFFTEKGYETKVFSLVGFGDNDSFHTLETIVPGEWRTDLLIDLKTFKSNELPLVIIGHSLGAIIGAEVANIFIQYKMRDVAMVIGICPAFSIRQWAVRLHEYLVRMHLSQIPPVSVITKVFMNILYPTGNVPIHKMYLNRTSRKKRQEVASMLDAYLDPNWPVSAVHVYLQDRQNGWNAMHTLATSGKLALLEAVEDEDHEGDVLCPPVPAFISQHLGPDRHLKIPGNHFLPLDMDPKVLTDILENLQ